MFPVLLAVLCFELIMANLLLLVCIRPTNTGEMVLRGTRKGGGMIVIVLVAISKQNRLRSFESRCHPVTDF